jgi:hypothetical protein
MKEIIDSQLTLSQALTGNPERPTPSDIQQNLGLAEVAYLSFDGRRHIGQIVVATSVMAEVGAFFRRALELKFPIDRVIPAADPRYEWDDEKLMTDNISSGFNYRLIAGKGLPSLHGQGRAFDINPRQNPYIRYEGDRKITEPSGAIWDKNEPGTLYAEHSLVLLMEGFGWEWGGHWVPESGRTDYQHFQKSSHAA